MPKESRLSDLTSHGGIIVTGSPKYFDEFLPVARITDIHVCPLHGANVIVTGSPTMQSDNLPVARITDSCACGAVIVTGSSTTTIDG